MIDLRRLLSWLACFALGLGILTTMFFTLTFAQADNTSVGRNISQLTTSSTDEQISRATMTESEAYKLLYNNVKESNASIISIIQWVIGISMAFLLAILGGQIFFNWRINTKEINFIKKDIDEKIGELKAELIKDYAQTTKEQDMAINVSLDKIEREIKQNITNQFNAYSELSKVQEKTREKEIELIKKEIELIKKEIDTKMKSLKVDINKTEGDLWKLKGVHSNALTNYISSAFLNIELGHEIKYDLNDIISMLEKREEIHEIDYNKLDELINKMTEKYNEQKEKIIQLYKHKPVYKWVDLPEEKRSSSGNQSEKIYVKNK